MRKLLVLSAILTSIMVALTIAYVAVEPARQASATARHRDEAVEKGTRTYASLCMSCHGPRGGGVVGLPLDRPVFREGGPDELESGAELLREAIRAGRPGTSTPSFLRAGDGGLISRTAMPAWSQERGGPLTDQQIEELVTFLQYGDWAKAMAAAPPPKMQGQMPAAPSLSAQAQEAGQNLFRAKGCIGCHTAGSVGGVMGPDLTRVGNWRDAEYLSNWIKSPQTVDRSNYTWSSGQKVPLGQAFMPAIPMTEAELKTLVDYLSALK